MLAALTVACGREGQSHDQQATEFAVRYFAFEIDPITGYHAADIEQVGCKFKIRSTDFDAVVGKRVGEQRFDPGDIKAQIIRDSGENMYVDDAGVLRNSAGYFLIDQARFENALVPTSKCEIPAQLSN